MMADLQYINKQFEYEMDRDVPSTGEDMTINEWHIKDIRDMVERFESIYEALNSGRVTCEDRIIECECGKHISVVGCGLRKYDDPIEYPLASRIKALTKNASRLASEMQSICNRREYRVIDGERVLVDSKKSPWKRDGGS